MNHPIVGCILAALPGVLIAWINARLTAKAARSGTTTLSLVPVLRMVLSVGYLALVFFVSPHLPWDSLWLLAGACVGLTLPMFFFTFGLLKQLNADSGQNENKESTSAASEPQNHKGGDS